MKRLENQTKEEFENRKTKRIRNVYVGFSLAVLTLGMVGYTVGMIMKRHNKYVKYDDSKDLQIEEHDKSYVFKKVL